MADSDGRAVRPDWPKPPMCCNKPLAARGSTWPPRGGPEPIRISDKEKMRLSTYVLAGRCPSREFANRSLGFHSTVLCLHMIPNNRAPVLSFQCHCPYQRFEKYSRYVENARLISACVLVLAKRVCRLWAPTEAYAMRLS